MSKPGEELEDQGSQSFESAEGMAKLAKDTEINELVARREARGERETSWGQHGRELPAEADSEDTPDRAA